MPGNYSKLVTVVTGQTITAAERNNEFDNVINYMTPDGVDDASANLTAMQLTVDPAGGSQATTLRGELNRLRFQLLKLGSAGGNWYDALPFLAGITPATPGATATDLNNRLAQIVKHLQTLNVASGNWYDTISFLAGITPAAAGATGTDLTNRLAQLASQIKNLGGLTNWYDAVTAALLKAGGTMAGAIAMGTNKVTGLGAGTTNGDALRYEQVIGLYLLLTGGTLTGNLVFNPTTKGIKGTTTNDAADALNVGEYIESIVTAVNFPATGVIGDLTSISLTAGDWDISAFATPQRNGATWTAVATGITATSGNSTTGRVVGSNWGEIVPGAANDSAVVAVPNYRVSLAGTTTYYLKMQGTFTVATPVNYGRLSARRLR
jgi:hypothetical protein